MSRAIQEFHEPLLGEADLGWLRDGSGKPVTAAIAARITREFSKMQQILGDRADRDAFTTLNRWTSSTLESIGSLVVQGFIRPAGATERRPSTEVHR